MSIEIDSLTKAGKSFAHTYSPAEMALDDEQLRLLEEVKLSGTAARNGERVRIDGTLHTKVEKKCDRCLRPTVAPLETTFTVRFVPQAEELSRESPVLEAEDLDVSILDGDKIDLDEVAREQILLEVGLRSLCREDCRGLCSTCGADLNEGECGCTNTAVDPRWAALAALREK